jgi:hypothetical protein
MTDLLDFVYPYDDSIDACTELYSRCNKYDFCDFDSKIFCDKFSIIHLNIRSAAPKFDELAIWITSLLYKPSIICLTETWFHVDLPPCSLPNYDIINVPRHARGGGVCMYINNSIKYSNLNITILHDSFECACILISSKPRASVVIVVYKVSPLLPVFLSEFSEFLSHVDKIVPNAFLFIAGDFNINLFSSNSSEFSNLLLTVNAYPTIYLPTRITPTACTLIDNIFTNYSSTWLSGVLNCNLSDHEMVFLSIDPICHVSPVSSTVSSVSTKKLIKFVGECNWNFVTETSNLNNDCSQLVDQIARCIGKASILHVNSSFFGLPWISAAIRNSCNHKHQLYKKYRKGEISSLDYNSYRNKLTSIIRSSKRNYYRDLFDKNKHNAREIWQHFNCLVDRVNYRSNSLKSVDPNKLNNFFANLGKSSIVNLDNPPFSHLKFVKSVSNSFYLTEVTEIELCNVVNSLKSKSSSGFDGLSVKNLKLIFPFISKALLMIINKSFTSGLFPDIFKIARVIPIYKGGDFTQMLNYRPISILSSFAKILERLMFNKMSSFIVKYHLLSNSQFGFRKGHNTELAIIHALNYITKALDNGIPTAALFVDVSKAFDAISHHILLDKLNLLGFRGVCHSWIGSYLSNRFQYVELNGVKSNLCKLTTGVPQGSILGPLLFLLYINDLANVSDELCFSLFADDTTVLYSNPSLKNSLTSASNAFSIVLSWFIANRLCLNITKTNFMFFSTGCMCANVLHVNNVKINRVDCTKFLGLFVDDKLSWLSHVNYLYKKLSKALGLLKVASHCFPTCALLPMYYALFHSHLIYGLLIWGNTYSSYLQPIKVLQKKCIRLLSNADFLAHTPPLALNLGILFLDDLYVYLLSIFMFKVYTYMLPECIVNMFIRLNTVHSITRRVMYNFYLPRIHLNICKKFIAYSGPFHWNKLPIDVKSCTLSDFKKNIFANFLDSYANL